MPRKHVQEKPKCQHEGNPKGAQIYCCYQMEYVDREECQECDSRNRPRWCWGSKSTVPDEEYNK